MPGVYRYHLNVTFVLFLVTIVGCASNPSPQFEAVALGDRELPTELVGTWDCNTVLYMVGKNKPDAVVEYSWEENMKENGKFNLVGAFKLTTSDESTQFSVNGNGYWYTSGAEISTVFSEADVISLDDSPLAEAFSISRMVASMKEHDTEKFIMTDNRFVRYSKKGGVPVACTQKEV